MKSQSFQYYISFLLFLNILYLLNIFLNNDIVNEWHSYFEKPYIIIIIVLVLFSLIVGIISSVMMLIVYDSINDDINKGITIKVSNLVNLSKDFYFDKFSFIVLTGLVLPTKNSFITILIYLIFIILLGIVYHKCNLFYLNPIFVIFGYEIISCTNENNPQIEYIFLIKGELPNEGENLTFNNFKEKIIRLKNIHK